jgi:hypothetical protein
MECLIFAITGSEKRCDKGAPLFTVRVDGVVVRLFGKSFALDNGGTSSQRRE